MTAALAGATLLNHAEATGLIKDEEGRVRSRVLGFVEISRKHFTPPQKSILMTFDRKCAVQATLHDYYKPADRSSTEGAK